MGGGSINNSSTSTEYVSAKALNDVSEQLLSEIVSLIFPVGFVLTTFDTADYTNYMGYTWERLQNTFLYADGTWSVGDVGGESTHTLSESEMPVHRHVEEFYAENQGSETVPPGVVRIPAGTGFLFSTSETPNAALGMIGFTDNRGNSQPHNNMPPYTVVRMWRRVS